MKRPPRKLALAALLTLLVSLQLPLAASAQNAANDNPVSVNVEIFVVSQVTKNDGTKEERFTPADSARPGQVVEYRLHAKNVSDTTLPAGIVQITGPIPEGMEYVANSATPSSDRVLTEFSADGGQTFSQPPVLVGQGDQRQVADPAAYNAIRWTLLVPMEPADEEPFFYRVTVK